MRPLQQWAGQVISTAVALRPAWMRCAALLLLMTLSALVTAQTRSSAAVPAAVDGPLAQRSVNEWLLRTHEAARRRAYVGTFVVLAAGSMSSARIWHVCDGTQQIERVESLTGVPRSTFRRNNQVMTFWPESRMVVVEKRESLGLFPNFLQSNEFSIAQFYQAQVSGRERVAGFEADVLELRPTDSWRFGYRLWSEKKTGLLLKLQTLDGAAQVLEQAAFSELQIDAPVSTAKLSQMMDNTAGYQVETPELVPTTASAEGWVLQSKVPGFKLMSCYKRPPGAAANTRPEHTLQWVFSDGLASVSLFVEVFDPRRHAQPVSSVLGATHTLTRRIGDWWLTAVGEVPAPTLAALVQGLERKK